MYISSWLFINTSFRFNTQKKETCWELEIHWEIVGEEKRKGKKKIKHVHYQICEDEDFVDPFCESNYCICCD